MILTYTRETQSGDEQELTIDFDGYYDEGHMSGPPEDCYPPEGEVTFRSVSVDGGKPEDWDAWAERVELTDEECRRIEAKAFEQIAEGDDYDPRDDDRDDRDWPVA